ncbi:MAG: DUF3443 family protein, partial [Burkholderia sp.]|nr:DUF3443 family protein [Burkholderia sp.]
MNAGPAGDYANGLFTTVTICASGTSNCQAISGVLVDTMSYGVRILSSAMTSTLSSALSQEKDANGSSVSECAQFSDSITWGPVKTADVKMASEVATAIPIQVIGDPAFSTVPAGCSSAGAPEDTLQKLGANGILGIGPFVQDCPECAPGTTNNQNFYYACAGSTCRVTTVSGSLIFGIGTQSNNSLGSARVFTINTSTGNISTDFKAKTYSSFLDTGSNAYFFLDSATTVMPTCSSPEDGFYCPTARVAFSATNTGTNKASSPMSFNIDNADTLFTSSTNNVFPTLGGPNPGTFDWGLPFFYGRHVFVAI